MRVINDGTLHINRGSLDAAAEAYESEYQCSRITHYCLGSMELRCYGCKKERNWQDMNEMPNEWRYNIQRAAVSINSTYCILSGRPFFEAAP